jgi:hypothetical membrane protein
MGRVTQNRLRGGALAWLLTLQFFLVETVAQAQMKVPYSRSDNTISVLGATDSPAHRLMNFSFLVLGVLIVAGALLLRPALRGRGARLAPPLLALAAIGVMIVGVFPRDLHPLPHAVGVGAYLVGAALGLICLAYGVRPRSEGLGTLLALLGVVSAAMSIFFLAGVTQYLGLGGTERSAGYCLPIALAIAGAALWRLGFGELAPDSAPEEADTGLTRAQERRLVRDEERARRADQEQARLAALEATADRASAPQAADSLGAHEEADEESDVDPEDPWASPTRRRD